IHDTPTISRSKPLQPGMCFSIEPGIYFPLENLPIKPEFRGIGLRIEDDILIDPLSGNIVNLTVHC
ncbi:M24 family metallopeptidase, partial [Klebsiella pneumoniae]|nr:M24 family metallopeptidase [Klebsiella pneumoniae]